MRRALACAVLALLPALAARAAPAPAPDFRAPRIDADGEMALADFRGHPLLLEFWASWCAPCWRGLAASTRLQAEWGPKGLQVLTISVDEDVDKAREFAARKIPTLPALADPIGRVADRYGVDGMPANYLIDCEGRIVARFEGFRDDTERGLAKAVAALVEAGCADPLSASRAPAGS